MPLDHQRRAIFIHIPKTGGTSIEQALGIYGGEDPFRLFGRQLQHLTAREIKQLWVNEHTYNSYFKFCFVRNPWDRLVSEHTFLVSRNATSYSFKELCSPSVLRSDKNPKYFYDHVRPQCDYIFDQTGTQIVDFIGRFENITEDWFEVCQKLDIKCDLPTSKKTKHTNYTDYYDAESRKWIETIYAEDIETFGYHFGG